MKNNNKLVFLILLLFSLTLVLSSCNFPLYFDRYNASGSVTDSNGNPIEEAVIKFDNGYDPEYTNSNGEWAKSGLGGTVTITAQKNGYSFSPSEYTITEEESHLNFVTDDIDDIKEQPYTASGTITYEDNDQSIADVEITFSEGFESVYTDSEGNWEKTGLTGELDITPVLEDWQFTPSNITISQESETTNLDFSGKPGNNFEFYSISGIIVDTDYNAIPGVLIEIRRTEDDTLLGTAVSDDSGNWTEGNLWGTVTVTPDPSSKSTVSGFNPVEQVISREEDNIDFIAQ